jgi:hypothetical protein
MATMVVCGVAVMVALVMAVRWRGYAFVLDPGGLAPGSARFRGLARVLTVGVLTGLVTGSLVVGPAGRLVMRLLGATSPDAQGFVTEAQEVVGRITVGGTISFVVFVGVPAGFTTALVYLFVAHAFPRGPLGGAMYGAALLVLFSWWIDPLRADNPDFDIVGPGWLVVVAFATMAVLTGVVTPPIAGRIDAALGQPTRRWLWWIVPTGLLATVSVVAAWPAAVVVIVGGALYLTLPSAEEPLRHRRRWALQAVVGLAVLITLPSFISAVVDIA